MSSAIQESANLIADAAMRFPYNPLFPLHQFISRTPQHIELDVTPELAAAMLERNHPLQRRRSAARIKRYARMIKDGHWLTNPAAIIFDTEGYEIQGQHTLHAVKLSGCTIRLGIAFGYPPDTRKILDRGGIRKAHEVIAMHGGLAGKDHVAVARGMMNGLGGDKASEFDYLIEEFITRHGDAIEFALGSLPKRVKRLSQAAVTAVMARAYYTADRERIREFAVVLTTGALSTGMLTPAEEGGLRLRNYLLTSDEGQTSGRGKRYVYAKTERALKAFLDRQSLDKLYAAPSELFPLPEESGNA